MNWNSDKEREQIAARKRMQEQYPEPFQWLADLLARHDPMGLIEMGAPEDEYEPEVGTILPRLFGLQQDERVDPELIRDIVVEEFARWISPGRIGRSERHNANARELAEALRSHRAILRSADR